jgi:hypothetical protein
MTRIPMTAAEIEELNNRYDAAREANPDERTNVLTYDVAVEANLTLVRHYDESGNLWRNAAGRYCFGWESGGFDDQVDDYSEDE